MKYIVSIFLVLALLLLPASSALLGGGVGPVALAYTGHPTISIVSVARNQTVTIRTQNMPPRDSFDVMMNFMGTHGRHGFEVGTIYSGNGASQAYTFNIPAALKGEYQIAIRIQSNSGSGYFAYNWFYNDTAGGNGEPQPNPRPGYSGFPTFSIISVARNEAVSIRTNNLPPNDRFVVMMNFMGTHGRNGIVVDTINSGEGGSQNFTFDIPAALMGQRQIAIRMQSNTGSGYFAYNWFFNSTAGGGTGGGGIPDSGNFRGFPTITILSVARGEAVTVRFNNLPPKDEFRVLMGKIGTRGISGIKVASIDTERGGKMKVSFDIPAELARQGRIAIRIESKTGSGYFAYNWFYNTTTY